MRPSVSRSFHSACFRVEQGALSHRETRREVTEGGQLSSAPAAWCVHTAGQKSRVQDRNVEARTRTYCIAHGILLNVMWQPGGEGNLGENGYMYICMAESLCCAPVIITTLLIGYTPMQNKNFFKN